MIIKLKKINRHPSFPFMVKEIILDIDGVEQPLCIGWFIKTNDKGYKVSVEVDEEYKEEHVYTYLFNKIKLKIDCFIKSLNEPKT